MNLYSQRVDLLRNLMRSRGWDAVVIYGGDPHSSEYPSDRWKQAQWLSGFSAEAADMVITADHCGLWTDTRFFIQAQTQLKGSGIVLHKTRVPDQVLIPQWLHQELEEDALIAVDGLCVTQEQMKELPGSVISVRDLLSSIWEDRPLIPQTPVYSIEAGQSVEEKLLWLREFLEDNNCDGIFISALDQIAWLLNIRASDIEYNPFAISYLLVTEEKAYWYVKKEPICDPVSESTFAALKEQGVEVLAYNDVDYYLGEFEGTLFVDPSTLNHELFSCIKSSVKCGSNPIDLKKAVKTESEIENMRYAHILDGVAMEKFLYWLEKGVKSGRLISEWDASVKLGQLRSQISEYRGDSFETISAYGPGAALPHYHTPHEDSLIIEEEGLYLCDSGGQYVCGTTDITRTVPMGNCSYLEKEDYTLVLQGHIALAMAVFPAGTAGCQIDALARRPLWKAKRNFGHGTGHGIGYFLGVHEGPQDIRQNFNSIPLLPGMVVSDEPGIYREGLHGVRHENLLLCIDAGTSEFGNWRAFQTLTLCHFDTEAILPGILNPDEIAWLNNYHKRVYSTLSPYLSEEEREWLRIKTEEI